MTMGNKLTLKKTQVNYMANEATHLMKEFFTKKIGVLVFSCTTQNLFAFTTIIALHFSYATQLNTVKFNYFQEKSSNQKTFTANETLPPEIRLQSFTMSVLSGPLKKIKKIQKKTNKVIPFLLQFYVAFPGSKKITPILIPTFLVLYKDYISSFTPVFVLNSRF
jgi:Na+/alanine symporter